MKYRVVLSKQLFQEAEILVEASSELEAEAIGWNHITLAKTKDHPINWVTKIDSELVRKAEKLNLGG